MAKINETLRQLRMDRGMTQEEVAEQVGLTRQAVSGYESGRTQPGIDILQRLAEIYETDLTDIIYGRSKTLRLYNALKITAIVMAAVVLTAQFLTAILMWTANQFFSLEPGTMSDAETLIWVSRSKLMDAWGTVEGFYYNLFPLFCVAILVLLLCQRRPITIKNRILCALSFVAASMIVTLPWALTDSFYPPVNYLTTPCLCLACLAGFLLLSLTIELFRTFWCKRKVKTAKMPDDQDKMVHVPIYKKLWFWVLIVVAVIVLLLSLIAVWVVPDQKQPDQAEVTPIATPAFSLNGVDFPQNPTMQDLIVRGWKRGKAVAKSGKYSEEKGVTELVARSYRMTSGETYITASLDVDQLRSGGDWSECRLDGLSFYAKNIMSFCVNDVELVGISRSELESVMGEPNRIDGPRNYVYRLTENGIKLMVTFNGDKINQILVDFNTELW